MKMLLEQPPGRGKEGHSFSPVSQASTVIKSQGARDTCLQASELLSWLHVEMVLSYVMWAGSPGLEKGCCAQNVLPDTSISKINPSFYRVKHCNFMKCRLFLSN